MIDRSTGHHPIPTRTNDKGVVLEYRPIPNHGPEWVRADAGPLVWLQGYGLCPARLVSTLVPGDVIVYNFGSTASVVECVKVTPKFARLTVLSNGVEYTRRAKLDSLVGVTRAPGTRS